MGEENLDARKVFNLNSEIVGFGALRGKQMGDNEGVICIAILRTLSLNVLKQER